MSELYNSTLPSIYALIEDEDEVPNEELIRSCFPPEGLPEQMPRDCAGPKPNMRLITPYPYQTQKTSLKLNTYAPANGEMR